MHTFVKSALGVLGLLVCFASAASAQIRHPHKPPVKRAHAVRQLTERELALHMLERFSFGPQPSDVERVVATGWEQWFEQQLHPDQIVDDALAKRLMPTRSLRMTVPELVTNYPPASLLEAVAQGKQPGPPDSELRVIYQTLIDKHEEDKRIQQATVPTDAERQAANKKAEQTALRLAFELLPDGAPARFNGLLALSVSDRRTLLEHLRGDIRDRLYDGFTPQQREILAEMQYGSGVAQSELQQAKVLRAVYSERQLLEVMTDFWFNHFNVFQLKDADQYYTTTYERDVIRAHALGKFNDLLLGVAHSPAMLFYLDNWSSIGPNSIAGGKSKRGLNENYGRELLELDTLGVNGGYTQQDVIEAARILTGWIIDHPERGGGFVFDATKHEPGPKRVLGKIFDQGGEREGIALLDMLAHQPATAKFICTELAQRFVSDDPSPALIESMAQTFAKSDGDMREVLRTMVHTKEFLSPRIFRAKIKTPLEFVISATRVTAAEIKNPEQLVRALGGMGVAPYRMPSPTGYSTAADAWINSAALLERLSFAIQFTNGASGVGFDARHLVAEELLAHSKLDPELSGDGAADAIMLLEDGIIGGDLSEQTMIAVRTANQAVTGNDPGSRLAGIAGLLIGSPEFQRR